ncbi:LOW QUALITY PROTEIN: UNC93-like protein MFSD11 [Uloborus diversus]|uniref:LOW QUALITY PROTEIN: UNC93-like protein MFSD11 n=1 Tax=Uloborus diversus TaxID=327109 RepID=UPI00240A3F63|nr:LOW QUALITY PROTEIN: UNC93-like protein MFSD11 [Uloborus diversus]
MAKTFDKMFLNVLLLGFAFMLVFTAFQTCGMIQKTVITSMKKSYENYDGDGYISLAVVYAVFSVSNWIAPSIICKLGPKVSMILGGLTYCLFIGNFFFHETWCLYLASAIVGFGASVIWTGQGNFLTINSDSDTMSRNSGVFWALLQCSLLFGNIFVFFTFQGKSEIDDQTRYTVFGVLLGVAIVGIVLMLFLRTNKSDSITLSTLTSGEPEVSGAKEEFVKAFKLLKTKEMLLLALSFLYTGLELSFFSGVYGAGISFTKRFGDDAVKYVGISGICIGIGEILGGAVFGILGKKTNKYGRDPVILLGFITHMITFYLICINLPAEATLHETPQRAMIESSVWIAMICAFGLGFGDSCYNTQIYSILGSMYAEESAPAFAIFKFFQSISAAAAFFYSTKLKLPYQLLILAISGTIGTFSFWAVEWNEYVRTAKETRELQSSEKL